MKKPATWKGAGKGIVNQRLLLGGENIFRVLRFVIRCRIAVNDVTFNRPVESGTVSDCRRASGFSISTGSCFVHGLAEGL